MLWFFIRNPLHKNRATFAQFKFIQILEYYLYRVRILYRLLTKEKASSYFSREIMLWFLSQNYPHKILYT